MSAIAPVAIVVLAYGVAEFVRHVALRHRRT